MPQVTTIAHHEKISLVLTILIYCLIHPSGSDIVLNLVTIKVVQENAQ